MITKTGTSTANTAYGKSLETPIKYDFSVQLYESIDEVNAANDNVTPDEVVKIRNAERTNNARQKALQAALDAAGIVRPTIENDDQLRLKNLFTVLMSSKLYSEQQARDLAASTLQLTWED